MIDPTNDLGYDIERVNNPVYNCWLLISRNIINDFSLKKVFDVFQKEFRERSDVKKVKISENI